MSKQDQITYKDNTNAFYALLANQKKKPKQEQSILVTNKEKTERTNHKVGGIYPKDLSLKSSIRIFAPTEIPWFSTSLNSVIYIFYLFSFVFCFF